MYLSSVSPVGRTKQRNTSCPPAPTWKSSSGVSTRSGTPSCQPSGNFTGGGASFGSPSGQPDRSHAASVSISCGLSDRAFLNSGPADGFLELAEHIEAAGLTPLVAHPERTEAVRSRRELADELAEHGWPLQVNSTSLIGRHGEEAREIGWRLVERGHAKVVASDGHRLTRPARLDDAYELVSARVGEEAAAPLFDGTALRMSSRRPTPSRAGARDA